MGCIKIKKMILKKYTLLLSLFFSITGFSQTDDSRLQVSIITCAPGNELYSIFGHTAIRIIDSTNQTDLFYNFGTFDFNDPNFLPKFVHGKLLYFLSIEEGNNFLLSYKNENRTIVEQVLNLNQKEKNNIQQSLIRNLKEENKFYKYDFLFDNCTTRIRDLLKNNSSLVCNKKLVNSSATFRNLLHIFLDSMNMQWSKLGIDLLMGSKVDKPLTIEQSTFLPTYLMLAIDSANNKHQFLISKKEYKTNLPIEYKQWFSPIIIFSIVFLGMLLLEFNKNLIAKKIKNYATMFFIFLTGIIGCVLLYMWFFTEHKSFANNYNLIWALPTNLYFVFALNFKTLYTKIYFKSAFIITVLLVVIWFILPQQFNVALLPFVVTMALCYYNLYKRVKT